MQGDVTRTGFRADLYDQSSPQWCFLIIWPLGGKKNNLILGFAIRREKQAVKEVFSRSASVGSLIKAALQGSRTLVCIQIVTLFVRGSLAFCVIRFPLLRLAHLLLPHVSVFMAVAPGSCSHHQLDCLNKSPLNLTLY